MDGGFGFLTDLIGIQMRNVEAIRQAQQKMLEGMGVLAKRQTAIIEGTLRRSVSEPSAVTSSDIRAVVSHQIESLKTTILENQANSNILSEIAARSSAEVATILQSRMMAALDEFKAALEHAIPDKISVADTLAPGAVTVQPPSRSCSVRHVHQIGIPVCPAYGHGAAAGGGGLVRRQRMGGRTTGTFPGRSGSSLGLRDFLGRIYG
jgi:Phasin protein